MKTRIVPSRCRYCDAPIKRDAGGNPSHCDPWGRMATYTCGSWDVTHGGMTPDDRRSKQCVENTQAKEANP